MGLESPPEFFTLKPYEKQEKDHYTLISGFRRYNTDRRRKVLKFSCISPSLTGFQNNDSNDQSQVLPRNATHQYNGRPPNSSCFPISRRKSFEQNFGL